MELALEVEVEQEALEQAQACLLVRERLTRSRLVLVAHKQAQTMLILVEQVAIPYFPLSHLMVVEVAEVPLLKVAMAVLAVEMAMITPLAAAEQETRQLYLPHKEMMVEPLDPLLLEVEVVVLVRWGEIAHQVLKAVMEETEPLLPFLA